MVAWTLLAIVSTKASPRPMAPAGGATSSLFSMAASNSATSRGVDPMAERGVHDDGDDVVGVLLHEREDGFVELLEARQRSPFGGEVRAVDDDVSWHTGLSVNHLDTANDGIAAPGERGAAGRLPCRPVVSAVLWDFGGVILTSPFEAFARYEREQGLPEGFIRRVNATNPLDNAWARLERGELDRAGFAEQFGAEARALGGTLSGERVLELLAGDIRPEMVTALERCREAELRTACLTNNISGGDDGPTERAAEVARIMLLFDVVVESSVVGVRKPEPEFYEIACRLLEVEPADCVFLDDLGVNLKPARAMGMTTIKVEEPGAALAELERVLGLVLT